MKEYIFTVIGVSLSAAVVIMLTPGGKNGGILKHIRFLASIALLCVMAGPLFNLIAGVNGYGIDSFFGKIGAYAETAENYDSIFYESISKFSAEELEAELKKRICSKFGISESNIEVRSEYELTDEKIEFKRILVILSGSGLLKDPRDIEEYVKNLTNTPCDCVI